MSIAIVVFDVENQREMKKWFHISSYAPRPPEFTDSTPL